MINSFDDFVFSNYLLSLLNPFKFQDGGSLQSKTKSSLRLYCYLCNLITTDILTLIVTVFVLSSLLTIFVPPFQEGFLAELYHRFSETVLPLLGFNDNRLQQIGVVALVADGVKKSLGYDFNVSFSIFCLKFLKYGCFDKKRWSNHT